MSARTVLVCGATGFIGRNVVERFANRPDLRVRAVCHHRRPFHINGVDWVSADLTKVDDVERVVCGVDVIVQMAAVTSGARDIVERPYIHVTDNAVMNSLLLRAAHNQGVEHLVFPSCSIMYAPREGPHDEESFHEGEGIEARYEPAARTKLYIEQMCRFFAGLGRTRFSVIRHSNVYGPHDKFDLERSHVTGATITKVMTAQDHVVVWGDGTEGRDLLFVEDMVRLIERLIDHQDVAFELLCAGTGKAVPVKTLVDRTIALSGKPLSVRFDRSKPGINTTVSLSSARAERLYDWRPAVGLDDGLTQTLLWWKTNHQG
ncbi:NAD(P)-dependent oxidoreductase [Thalassobaculum sp.]|uniref:NAD-dependent epimerase/dehydratase family protein n=1 Tax=Thalassobaculum sp. TaxID=2022740 RepID=UPI0032F07E71